MYEATPLMKPVWARLSFLSDFPNRVTETFPGKSCLLARSLTHWCLSLSSLFLVDFKVVNSEERKRREERSRRH